MDDILVTLSMQFIAAKNIFDGLNFMPPNTVLVIGENDVVLDVINVKDLDHNNILFLDGIITPGFINAHCHLELSHLKNKIPQGIGLPEFAEQVIKLRNQSSLEEKDTAMSVADEDMWKNGIVAVGDISNTSESFYVKSRSKIHYHTFIELIGLRPNSSEDILENGKGLLRSANECRLIASLAPHAPYSTSTELISMIGEFNSIRHQPSSMHNQESEEEESFIQGKTGGFTQLFQKLGLDLSWYQAPGKRSIQHTSHAIGNHPYLLVHNVTTEANETELPGLSRVSWCLCPKANLYISELLPKKRFVEQVVNDFCVGTDSLASNSSLCILSELNVLKEHFELSLETLLKAATYNGARALHLPEHYGRIKKGFNSGLNLIREEKNNIKLINKLL